MCEKWRVHIFFVSALLSLLELNCNGFNWPRIRVAQPHSGVGNLWNGEPGDFRQPVDFSLPSRNAFCAHVTPGVFCEVVWTHELPVAKWTLELAFAGMTAFVPGEFIGPGECSLTTFPWTFERFFPCNKKQNHEMRLIKSIRRKTKCTDYVSYFRIPLPLSCHFLEN